MKLLFSFAIVFLLCHSATAQGSAQLKNLAKRVEEIDDKLEKNDSLWRGNHPKHIYTITWEDLKKANKEYQGVFEQLQAISGETLSRQDQISREILLLQLQDKVSSVRYKSALIPFNAEGGFYNRHEFFLNRLPFTNKNDYQAYLEWLPDYSNYLKQNQDLMAQGLLENVVAPKLIVRNLKSKLEQLSSSEVSANPFFRPFTNMPSTITPADSLNLANKAAEVISQKIIPAYQQIYNFVSTEYMTGSPEEVGIRHIENGKAYYEDRIRFYTTLNISPDSVFNLGMHEVRRIKKEMDKIIKRLKFKGSFQEFQEFLRTDPQFYPRSANELLYYASWLSKKAEGKLPKLFSHLYELPFTVEPVPAAIAPTYTSGRYVGGSRKNDRPGIYWVNTYNLSSRTLYTIPALTLHEAVPGHHLQMMIAAELDNVPAFRRNYYISAFGEGWGLYAEYLGEEMDMYTTPYDFFGRYTYEMWRACRLVVDVGMHYKGWSREKAFKFMSENTALSLHEVNTEIDRYIGWPGQAVSYKIGEITIKNLREKASRALGDKFNIQEFHNRILRNGSVPLPVLVQEINNYIEEKDRE